MLNIKNRLHATTWWVFGVLGAVTATLSRSGWLLFGISFASVLAMFLFRDRTLRSRSIAFYSWLALAVISIRILFRVVFNQPDFSQPIAAYLPELKLQLVGLQIQLFGAITWSALVAGFVDGLRLAAIILAIGMANTVANPRKLLRSTPAALYEIATAAAVAINLAPQLVESLHRVRKSRQLRGLVKGYSALGSLVIPVLEDAFNRSLELAASMDARGFGLQNTLSKPQRQWSKFSTLGALVLAGVTSFTLVATELPIELSIAGFAVSILLLALSFRFAAKHKVRSFYRIEKPEVRDYLAIAAVFGVFTLAWWVSR